ncbi:MAG: RNA polymerase sigma factor [Planctomycetota bacterium]|jgi:RNA polymerase sigma-70 factor (ECF subfamily)
MARSREDILDEWLVFRIQEGDTEALRELVSRWNPKLWRHARRLIGETDAAADALQDAWLAIVRGLPRLRDPAVFRSWAYRIVSRRCADWIRRRQRDRAMNQGAPADPAEAPAPAGTPASASDDIAAVRQAIRELPADHRLVLSLHYLEGLSVREIACALDIPAGTVKSRLHHARNILRETLERIPT